MGKSPAQILIRWSLQHNVSTIPKSTKKSRILENFQVLMHTWLVNQSTSKVKSMVTVDGAEKTMRANS